MTPDIVNAVADEYEAQLALLAHREQFIAHQRDVAIDDLRDIMAAWNEAGPVPDFHAYMKSKLHREWPVLARALDVAASHRA